MHLIITHLNYDLTLVGYQQIQVAPGWMLFCPTFKDVSKQYMDLNQIRIVKNDGSEFNTDGSKSAKGKCKGAVTINKLGDDGIYQTGYSYYSNLTKKDGVTYGAWSSDSINPIDDNVVKLYAGEGFALNNEYKYDSSSEIEAVRMCVAGEVDLVCSNLVAAGWSIMGNFTQADLDLTQIRFCKQDGTEFNTDGSKSAKGKCKGAITINKLGGDGIYQTGYSYYSNLQDKSGKYGAWSSDSINPIDVGMVPLKSGEAFAVNVEYKYDSTSEVEPVLMVLPAPNVK